MNPEQFTIEVKNDYIHLVTLGNIDAEAIEAPAKAAIELAKETHITKLLNDIRDIKSAEVDMAVQVKAIHILWDLRIFKKAAFVISGLEMNTLVLSSLKAMHLDTKFKVFDNESEAIAWLNEDTEA